MPIRWAVRITRQAISPRFAMRRVFNIWRVVRSKPQGLDNRFYGIALFLDSVPQGDRTIASAIKLFVRKTGGYPLPKNLHSTCALGAESFDRILETPCVS